MKTRRSGWNRGGTVGRWLACVAAMCLPLSGRSADEKELLEILRSNAGPVAKAEACKGLRLYGSAAAVDALAALLGDARMAHAARHALEGLPFVEATRALREAVGRLKDAERLGVVDSLGWRRDAESVPVLVPLLNDADPTTAGAAATALGRIASDGAVVALRKAKDRVPVAARRAVMESLLAAAEARVGAGRLAEARAFYAELIEPGEEPGIRVAAHLGAMRASDDGGLAAAVAALEGEDPDAQLAALAAAPGLRSEGATAALAGLLSRTSDAVRVGLLGALRQRRDGAAMDAVLRASSSTNTSVRWAALSALGDLGDATAIPTLVSAAASKDPEEQTVARESLAVLRRGDVDGGLIAALGSADGAARREVFRALAARGDSRAAPALIELARGEDPGIRGGALQALGALAEPKHMAALVGLFRAARDVGDREEVLGVFETILERFGSSEGFDPDPVFRAMSEGEAASRVPMFELGALLGDARLRPAFVAALKDSRAEIRAGAARALNRSRDEAMIDPLLEAARTAAEPDVKSAALTALVRLATDDAVRADVERRAAAIRAAWGIAQRPDDRRGVVSGAGRVPHRVTLAVAEVAAGDATLRSEAETASLRIVRALGAAEFSTVDAVLARLEKDAGDDAVRSEAAGLRRQLNTGWLASGPYRVQGKTGDALFDEVFAPERPDGGGASWQRAPGSVDPARAGELDLSVAAGGDHAVVYAKSRVYAPTDANVVFSIGSDDGIKLWVNGAVVHANNAVRGLTPGEDRAKGRLKAGWNDVLAKVTQHTAGCGLNLRILDENGAPVPGLRWSPTGER